MGPIRGPLCDGIPQPTIQAGHDEKARLQGVVLCADDPFGPGLVCKGGLRIDAHAHRQTCYWEGRITRPRDVKETPCCVRVLIMTDSTMGGFTGRSDVQETMKLAPDPPLLSRSGTT